MAGTKYRGSMEEKFQLLGSAIESQRGILKKHIDKPIEEIPQIFVPYKEVLDIYEKGLKVPEDITIVWPDDNYGYIKKLSNADERKRNGGSGVYYHISYLGWPNDYLWLNTASPALMYAEMQKAWSLGADRYWLLNAGDIKPGELGVQLFLDMAWDFDSFTFENVNEHNADFLASIFGKDYEEEFAYILDRFVRLLEEDVQKEHEVAFYADKLGITPHYLTMVTNRYVGMSAGKVIAEALMSKACQYLRNPEYTIQEVAEMLNFSDQSSFGKFFRKHSGTTPASYRKAAR